MYSADDNTYMPLGAMQRVDGGWRYSGFTPPLHSIFYLRARGQLNSGTGNRSNGLIESTRQFYLDRNDSIFASGFEP
jgi:hypothetical protein